MLKLIPTFEWVYVYFIRHEMTHVAKQNAFILFLKSNTEKTAAAAAAEKKSGKNTRPVFEGYLFLRKNSPPLHFHLKVNFDGKNSLSEQILFIFIARLLACLHSALADWRIGFAGTIRHTHTVIYSHMHRHVWYRFLQWNSNLWIYGFHNFSMWNDFVVVRFKSSLQHHKLAGKSEEKKMKLPFSPYCMCDCAIVNVLYSIFKWLHIAIMLTGKLICVPCDAVRHIQGKKPMQTELNIALVHFYC